MHHYELTEFSIGSVTYGRTVADARALSGLDISMQGWSLVAGCSDIRSHAGVADDGIYQTRGRGDNGKVTRTRLVNPEVGELRHSLKPRITSRMSGIAGRGGFFSGLP